MTTELLDSFVIMNTCTPVRNFQIFLISTIDEHLDGVQCVVPVLFTLLPLVMTQNFSLHNTH